MLDVPEAEIRPGDDWLGLAVAAWGLPDPARAASRLAPELRARLSAPARPSGSQEGGIIERLLAAHRTQIRPDLSRLHPSWFVRALKDETEAIRVTVGRVAEPEVRIAVAASLPADSPDTRPNAEAVAWSLGLWRERLVGDVATASDDPPVVASLTSGGDRGQARAFLSLGLAKAAYLGDEVGEPDAWPPKLAHRLIETRHRLEALERTPERLEQARRDLGTADEFRSPHGLTRIGLLSVARLLASMDPYRLRWVLQHLPYPVARQIRAAIEAPAFLGAEELAAWERELWQRAGEAETPGSRESEA